MSDFIQLEYLQEKLQQLLAESLFAILSLWFSC